MILPSTCPSELLRRALDDKVTSTADSFKSWDTCMDNKTCKIVAIVGIVLASLVVIGLLSTVLRCMCCGVTSLVELCCCCCQMGSRREQPPPPRVQQNPFMYPQERRTYY